MTRNVMVLAFMFCSCWSNAQVKWVDFTQLDSALAINPKPVFLDFYTEWCVYCKKMDKEAFTNQKVVEKLNKDFYAVRFDAENEVETSFDGVIFKKELDKRFHDLALFFANSTDEAFAPPVLVFLDKDFQIVNRVNAYLSRKKLLRILDLVTKE